MHGFSKFSKEGAHDLKKVWGPLHDPVPPLVGMGRFRRRSLEQSAWAELSHSPGGAQPGVRSQGTLSPLQRPLVPQSVMTQGSRLRGRFGLGVLARLWGAPPDAGPRLVPGSRAPKPGAHSALRRQQRQSSLQWYPAVQAQRRGAVRLPGSTATRALPAGEKDGAVRQREQGRIHTFHLVPLALQHHQPQTTQTPRTQRTDESLSTPGFRNSQVPPHTSCAGTKTSQKVLLCFFFFSLSQ